MADNMIITSSNINIKEGQLISLNLVLYSLNLVLAAARAAVAASQPQASQTSSSPISESRSATPRTTGTRVSDQQ
eukprot:1203913-Rhodomonas_salina.1